MIVYYADSVTELDQYIDFRFKNAMKYIADNILASVSDMKDIQGDINTLSYMSRFSLQSKFQTVYEKACTAWDYEKSGDHENAIKKWGEIFGSDFPEYG